MDDSEELELGVDDNTKVYVSRLPNNWNEAQLSQHFKSCFGAVKSVEIKWDSKNDCSLGYGFVVFETEESKNAAVEQGSMHVKKKTIQIRTVERKESALGRGRDSGICYLWQKSSCVKGADCKFAHDGPGACATVSAFGEGKLKKCLSFKAKGKCNKGDSCPFAHVYTKEIAAGTKERAPDDGRKKFCRKFQKTGKCRSGDACMFSHESVVVSTAIPKIADQTIASDRKRRRIDGDALVSKKKAHA